MSQQTSQQKAGSGPAAADRQGYRPQALAAGAAVAAQVRSFLAASRHHRGHHRDGTAGAGRHGLRRAGRHAATDDLLRRAGCFAALCDLRHVAPAGGRGLLGAGGHVVLDRIRPGAARNLRVYRALHAPWRSRPGFVAILAGLLHLGRIAQFFSASVLVGFVSGLAVVVAVKQLPKLFGIESGSGNVWERLYDLMIHLPETHLLTLARRRQHDRRHAAVGALPPSHPGRARGHGLWHRRVRRSSA